MSTSTFVLLPTGRQVFGDLYNPRPKTDNTGKPKLDSTGKPMMDYGIGYAIAKGGERAFWETPWGATIYQVAAAAFPNAVQLAVGELQAGRDASKYFAFKVIDGDSQIPNKNGKKPADQEGYPGHWVLRLGSSFAPRIYNSNGSALIPDPGAVKNGFYIQCNVGIVGNDSTQSPGVYLNLSLVALQGYGPEISSGPDAAAVGFGGGPKPAGMQAVPAGAMQPPAMPGLPPPAAPAPGYPPPPGVMAPLPPTAVAPAPSFLTPPAPGYVPPPVAAPAPVYAPPPPMVAPPPYVAPAPAAPAQQMTAKAGGASYAQMVAAGWNDATLRQHGYMA